MHLCIMALANAVLELMTRPECWEPARGRLSDAIEIIQYGCAAPAAASAS